MRQQGVAGGWRGSVVCVAGIISACSASAPIQPVATSRSAFEGAAYQGETLEILPIAPNQPAYRVFNQAGRGFVSMQSVRKEAERRATEFCGHRGKAAETLQETVAYTPYVLGHVPRIEIVFDCFEFGRIVDDRY